VIPCPTPTACPRIGGPAATSPITSAASRPLLRTHATVATPNDHQMARQPGHRKTLSVTTGNTPRERIRYGSTPTAPTAGSSGPTGSQRLLLVRDLPFDRRRHRRDHHLPERHGHPRSAVRIDGQHRRAHDAAWPHATRAFRRKGRRACRQGHSGRGFRVGTRFHSVRDVMIKVRQFINGWSEPLSALHEDQARRPSPRQDQEAIELANTPLARWGLGGREVRHRRSRSQPTPEDPKGEHHREHRIAQGGGLQDQPRQGNHQSQQ